MPGKPPTIVDLTWLGDLRFSAQLAKTSLVIDSAGLEGPSPVETLGVALAGCMSVDITYILSRARHSLRALRSHLTAQRSLEEPHRFVGVLLHFTIESTASAETVHRAIALSREKYCSVWHSLSQDIDFQVTFELVA